MTGQSERQLGRAGRLALAVLAVGGTFLATADPFTLIYFVGYIAVGALLVIRRPGNIVSWLLVVIAIGFIATTVPQVDVPALLRGDGPLGDRLQIWVAGWAGQASFLGYLALIVLFPSGRLPEGRWRRPAALLLGLGVVLVVIAAAAPTVGYSVSGGAATVQIPNPVAILPGLPIWSVLPLDALVLIQIVLLAVGVASMLIRYRRSTGVLRLQLRWLVASALFVVVGFVAAISLLFVFGERIGGGAWIPLIFAYVTVPLAIGIAILRYRLYDIDRIISRTIGWAIVTGTLLAVFGGAVLGLQALLSSFTQGQTLAVAASTLVAFALFQPIRRRVQSAVDRRFDRGRVDAERTSGAFAARLRDQVDLAAVEADVTRTIETALRPSSVRVWIRPPREEAAR